MFHFMIGHVSDALSFDNLRYNSLLLYISLQPHHQHVWNFLLKHHRCSSKGNIKNVVEHRLETGRRPQWDLWIEVRSDGEEADAFRGNWLPSVDRKCIHSFDSHQLVTHCVKQLKHFSRPHTNQDSIFNTHTHSINWTHFNIFVEILSFILRSV